MQRVRIRLDICASTRIFQKHFVNYYEDNIVVQQHASINVLSVIVL